MFKVSSDGKFQTTRLSDRVVIIEALGQDWYGWDNAEYLDDGTVFPAFLAYFGCDNKEQALACKMTIERFYNVEEITARSRRDTRTGYPVELKIRGLQRLTDCHSFGLVDLVGMAELQDDLALFSA